MKDCKIIRDLFPSYIDGLTDVSTNQYIEEHLNNCNECQKVLEDMKKDLQLDTTKKDSKEVKYIKKYNKKMKILKIVVLAILLIFIFTVARNMIIIVSLNKKANSYTNSKNYYMKSIFYSEDSLLISENYKKDDRYIMRDKIISEIDNMVNTEYNNAGIVNNYTEIEFHEEKETKKIATLNKENSLIPIVIGSSIQINNPIDLIGNSVFSTITSENCNGKECYRVAITSLNDKGEAIYYIDKETGLTIRSIGASSLIKNDGERYDHIADFQYKFDVVTDEDFIEPDISKYEIAQ